MSKSTVRMDYSQLTKLKKQLEKQCNAEQVDDFIQSCAKELAARLIAKTVKRTPVGDYSGDDYVDVNGRHHKGHYVEGKVGGTLRRGWTSNKNATEYVNSLDIQHTGDAYIITITNPVEYASYVEYGHRTANHRGWVEGNFMLTISENEINQAAPQILQKKLTSYLKGIIK